MSSRCLLRGCYAIDLKEKGLKELHREYPYMSSRYAIDLKEKGLKGPPCRGHRPGSRVMRST